MSVFPICKRPGRTRKLVLSYTVLRTNMKMGFSYVSCGIYNCIFFRPTLNTGDEGCVSKKGSVVCRQHPLQRFSCADIARQADYHSWTHIKRNLLHTVRSENENVSPAASTTIFVLCRGHLLLRQMFLTLSPKTIVGDTRFVYRFARSLIWFESVIQCLLMW